jgi:hypothetical protein
MNTKKITLAFLNIDYLYKVLCNDSNFYHFLSCANVKYFSSVREALKDAKKHDIKGLKVIEIDELNNVKTLKYI